MEISDALVKAITRELIRRMEAGEIRLSAGAGNSPERPPERPAARPVAGSGAGRKAVIGEAEIMRLCPPSSEAGRGVEIGPKDIVTPLAMDYIAKMKIVVRRAG